jgi:hypothetical protein
LHDSSTKIYFKLSCFDFCTKSKVQMEIDFLQLQQSVIIALCRSIFDRRLRSFYFIKLYIKFKLFDLKSIVIITYPVELHHCVKIEIENSNIKKKEIENSVRYHQLLYMVRWV